MPHHINVNAFQATELQELHLLYKYPQYPWCIVEKGVVEREEKIERREVSLVYLSLHLREGKKAQHPIICAKTESLCVLLLIIFILN